MNKSTFFKELRQKLNGISAEEREAAIAYYEEYFQEAEPEGEYAVLQKLGSPSEVAANIIANLTGIAPPEPPLANAPAKSKFAEGLCMALFLFTLPISASLFVATAILCVTIVFLFVAFGLTGIIMSVTGVTSIISGFTMIVSHPINTLFFLSIGIAAVGLGTIMTHLPFLVIPKLLRAIHRLTSRLFRKARCFVS